MALNKLAPQFTLDIKASNQDSNVFSVMSRSNINYNIIAQNQNYKGISVYTNDSYSSIDFWNDRFIQSAGNKGDL